MGIAEILTAIFIVLKCTHAIDWAWGWVLLPEIIAFALYAALTVGSIVTAAKTTKRITKHFDDFDKWDA